MHVFSMHIYIWRWKHAEGACGYDQKDKDVYGVDTTALSGALFKNGEACGACYEIKCAKGGVGCKAGQQSIIVTATNSCPSGGLGWCNPPKEHFDLSQPAYLKIAEYKAGKVPVQYRRYVLSFHVCCPIGLINLIGRKMISHMRRSSTLIFTSTLI